MPHGAVVRIEEIIINAEHLAQHLTHGGCSVVNDRERCNFIMHNQAPTPPQQFILSSLHTVRSSQIWTLLLPSDSLSLCSDFTPLLILIPLPGASFPLYTLV